MFNYIITCHNSESHLRNVLEGVQRVRGEGSQVWCVLDGCTDGSKAICDEFKDFNQIVSPNVRETRAISIALSEVKPLGYNLILQDDVVLEDLMTEFHIKQVYAAFPKIGVLGFRHGANFKPDVLDEKGTSSEMDLIQNTEQPTMFLSEKLAIDQLEVGCVTERQIVYKSPICISSEVVAKLGGYDHRFEPIAHDDTEYCIRALIAGYKNYVCGMELMQPPEWGGTRRNPETHKDNFQMHLDHMALLKELYPIELYDLGHHHPPLTQTNIWAIS